MVLSTIIKSHHKLQSQYLKNFNGVVHWRLKWPLFTITPKVILPVGKCQNGVDDGQRGVTRPGKVFDISWWRVESMNDWKNEKGLINCFPISGQSCERSTYNRNLQLKFTGLELYSSQISSLSVCSKHCKLRLNSVYNIDHWIIPILIDGRYDVRQSEPLLTISVFRDYKAFTYNVKYNQSCVTRWLLQLFNIWP